MTSFGKGSKIPGRYIAAVAAGVMTSDEAADKILGNKKPEDNFWLSIGLAYEIEQYAKEHTESMKAKFKDYKSILLTQAKMGGE